MERIIKFRGKRVDNGEWECGHLLHRNQTNSVYMSGKDMNTYYIVPLRFNISGLNLVKVFPETVGQFTGLFDKHDTEIYEGDVVSNGVSNFVVKYRNECYWLVNRDKFPCYRLCDIRFEIKIIGNIHDNPKLFKSDSDYIYRVSFRNELSGENVCITDIYFASLSAICDMFTVEEIGCNEPSLLDLKITQENPYIGSKCTISKEPLAEKKIQLHKIYGL